MLVVQHNLSIVVANDACVGGHAQLGAFGWPQGGPTFSRAAPGRRVVAWSIGNRHHLDVEDDGLLGGFDKAVPGEVA